jgi:putative oligomerization/nucleic acid binding protein
MPLGRRGPGLIGTAARTAVFAGTMGAVQHRQQKRYAAQDQAEYDQQMAQQQEMMAQQQAAAPPPAAPEEDKFAKLQQLAELQKQGILTDEEFAAEKAKILGS